MIDWFTLTPTINLLEVITFTINLIGLLLGAVLYHSAHRDRGWLRSRSVNGLVRLIADATVNREAMRFVEQGVLLFLVVNAMFVPSPFGWRSMVISSSVMLLSLFVMAHSVAAWRLRRQIAAWQEAQYES